MDIFGLIRNNRLVRRILQPVLFIYREGIDYFLPDRYVIRKRYKKRFGEYPDLDNPQTLNEKIQWLKLNERTSLHTKCTDKYLVRGYVEETAGSKYLIPLFLMSRRVEDLNSESLPDEPFIVKTNNDSGGGIVVKDKNQLDWKRAREEISKRMKLNYYRKSKEWQYKDIDPCFIVEKLLIDSHNQLPLDYKIHCFNGRAEVIGVDIDRFSDHRRNLYNREWDLLPFTWSAPGRDGEVLWPNGRNVPEPECLEEIIRLAEKMSAPFCYCRVDLYVMGRDVFFGEMTFHHGGGREVFCPDKWDLFYGNMLSLNKMH